MISLIIDGKAVAAEDGETILSVALRNGIYIPNLCYDKRLEPYGGCRLCIVEVEGQGKLLAACSSPAQEGMVVKTDTPTLRKHRQTVIELLLVHHPLECPECDKAGECDLQDLAYEFGKPEARFIRHRKEAPSDVRGPLIELNSRRCILCGKCVRICRDHQGRAALGLIGRGFSSVVQPAFGEALECDYCGQCLDICPTGAILSKPYKFTSRSWFLEEKDSICPFCGVGCTLTLGIREGKILRSRGILDKGVNEGNLCGRGRFGTDYIHSEKRLTDPLIKQDGEFKAVTWEEALTYAAKNLKTIIHANGKNSIGAIGSPRCTNEDNYALQTFMREIVGTGNMDSSAAFGYAKVQKAMNMSFGTDNHPIDLKYPAGKDIILILESDLSVTHPVFGLNIMQAARKGSRFIVADSRETKFTRHSSKWLRINDGTSVALLNGLMNVIVDRGLYDREAVSKNKGFSIFQTLLENYAPDRVSGITGILPEDIISLAEEIASAKSRMISFSVSASENTKSLDTVLAAANLVNLLGDTSDALQIPAEYSNTYGLYQMGVRPLNESADKGIAEMLYSEVRTVNALYVMGEDPATTFPNSLRVTNRLKDLDFLIVQDIFLTDTAKLANVVLPASGWSEKEGTFMNAEGKAQKIHKLINPAGQSVPDWMILKNLSLYMEQEIGFRNLQAVQEGAEKMLSEQVPSEIRRTFTPVDYFKAAEAGAGYPTRLVIRDIMLHSGKMSTSSKSLDLAAPEALLEINEEDAKKAGIADKSHVKVISDQGSVFLKTKISEDVPEGIAFVPAHFPHAKINTLTRLSMNGEPPIISVKIEAV